MFREEMGRRWNGDRMTYPAIGTGRRYGRTRCRLTRKTHCDTAALRDARRTTCFGGGPSGSGGRPVPGRADVESARPDPPIRRDFHRSGPHDSVSRPRADWQAGRLVVSTTGLRLPGMGDGRPRVRPLPRLGPRSVLIPLVERLPRRILFWWPSFVVRKTFDRNRSLPCAVSLSESERAKVDQEPTENDSD